MSDIAGVSNIEMESPEFAAFTYHLHIPAILMCVTLLDRMQGDQVRLVELTYL